MRGIVGLLLTSATLGLLLFVIFVHDEDDIQRQFRLFDIDPLSAVEIGLESVRGRFRLRKVEGEWWLSQPRLLPADTAAMSALMDFLSRAALGARWKRLRPVGAWVVHIHL